ncbi:hypothetical protein BDF14DRAFT_1717622, partial [Spinellus fusiger]
LYNEFKTSNLCPECKFSPLKTFKHVKNPRPYQRTKILQVKCHFFLIIYIKDSYFSLQIGVQTNIIWTRH